MKKTSRKKIKLGMLLWIFMPGAVMGIFISILFYNEMPSGWRPLPHRIRIASAHQNEYSKYMVEKPDIQKYEWNGKGVITLWFDDAWLSQYAIAFPMLEKYGYKAAMAVPTQAPGYTSYVTWDQLRMLQSSGWEISSHSVDHDCEYLDKGPEEIENQLRESKTHLIREGLRNSHYVTPCGTVTEELKQLTAQHYDSLRRIGENVNLLPVKDPYDLEVIPVHRDTPIHEIKWWIEQAKEKNMWAILMFHQIDSDENPYGVSAETLQELLDFIKTQDMDVVLPAEALSIGQKEDI